MSKEIFDIAITVVLTLKASVLLWATRTNFKLGQYFWGCLSATCAFGILCFLAKIIFTGSI